MYINRYASDSLIRGKILGTNNAVQAIRDGIFNRQITVTYYVTREGDRLDVIAGNQYGDGRLWWVIAAASGIGWWLQIPPDTRIAIPTDLSQIQGII